MMKKRFLYSKRVAVSILAIFLLLSLPSCVRREMKDYYSDRDNYITVTGTVSHMKYNDWGDILYLGFSDTEFQTPQTDLKNFESNTFKIVGENLDVVQQHGVDDKIEIGDKVTFVVAPSIFYDAYAIPIVSISTDDECLLGFDEGVSNLLDWLDTERWI